MATSGGGARPSNRITLLRDTNGDGKPETQQRLPRSSQLRPSAWRWSGNDLYVANTDAIVRYPYNDGDSKIAGAGTRADRRCPAGRSIITGPRAWWPARTARCSMSASAPTATSPRTAWRRRRTAPPSGRSTGRPARWRIFASGLRNPNGLSWEPQSGALWAVINERDELGPNLVPDYMTSVKDGGFYGWPYSYYGQHVDPRVQPQRPDLVAKAIVPDYALSSHVAPLGLWRSTRRRACPQTYRGGAFVGEHGSWDRQQFNGYKVVFVPFNGRTSERQGRRMSSPAF